MSAPPKRLETGAGPGSTGAALQARIGPALLQVRLALRRLDPGRAIAVLLLLLAATLWSWIVPQAQHRAADRHAALVRLQHMPAAAKGVPAAGREVSLPRQRLAAFYETLGERRYAEQQLRTLFSIAERSGLKLAQGDYKLRYDAPSRSWRYQLVLPVRGSYAALRGFTEKLLVAIPFASVDQLGFSRQAIGDPLLDARLRVTFYLGDGAPAAAPATSGAAPAGRAGGDS